jgi:predicted lipase
MDWEVNFEFKSVIEDKIVGDREQVYPYAGKSKSGAMMHQGFTSAYMSVRDTIHTYLKKYSIPCVTVTGHSLGGALATLCAVDVQYNFPDVDLDLYTFGSPRVGNDGFRDSFNRRVPKSYRFVYGMDIVPALPRPWQGYRHVDTEYRLGPRFSWNFLTQRFKDHAIDNYINALKDLAEKEKSGEK